jgi:hypothetical protein
MHFSFIDFIHFALLLSQVGHYAVQRAFAPLLVAGQIDNGLLVVRFSRSNYDSLSSTTATLRLKVLKWAGGAAGEAAEHTVTLPPPHASAKLFTASLSSVLEETSCKARNECLLHLEVVGADGTVLATNSVYLSPFNQVSTMHDPSLAVLHVKPASGELRSPLHRTGLAVFNVTVTATQVPVPFVWAETKLPGRWSDNGMLMTELVMQLQWFTDDLSVTASQLAAELSISSLVDVASGYSHRTSPLHAR